ATRNGAAGPSNFQSNANLTGVWAAAGAHAGANARQASIGAHQKTAETRMSPTFLVTCTTSGAVAIGRWQSGLGWAAKTMPPQSARLLRCRRIDDSGRLA